MSSVPLLASGEVDGGAMSCEQDEIHVAINEAIASVSVQGPRSEISCECNETLTEVAWLSNYVLHNQLHISETTALKMLRDGARAALAAPCSCVDGFIADHAVTCDCCNHVLLDVTAAREGSEQHCVAGSEGDGMGCAHSWRETVVTLEAEGDQLRADNEDHVRGIAILNEQNDACHGVIVELQAERDQLRADNERLRAALRATIDEVRTILQCGPKRDLLIQANAALRVPE